jgi:hypothetical protein
VDVSEVEVLGRDVVARMRLSEVLRLFLSLWRTARCVEKMMPYCS